MDTFTEVKLKVVRCLFWGESVWLDGEEAGGPDGIQSEGGPEKELVPAVLDHLKNFPVFSDPHAAWIYVSGMQGGALETCGKFLSDPELLDTASGLCDSLLALMPIYSSLEHPKTFGPTGSREKQPTIREAQREFLGQQLKPGATVSSGQLMERLKRREEQMRKQREEQGEA